MGTPTVKLVADVTPEIKEKLRRTAQKRGISIKDLIIQLAKELPEELPEEEEELVPLPPQKIRYKKQLKRPPI